VAADAAAAAASARLALSITAWCEGNARSPALDGSINFCAAVLSCLGRDVEGSVTLLLLGLSSVKHWNVVSYK
jgi:hypothetical protein